MKRRILIIDDDAIVRESMRRVLEGVGYEVVVSPDGHEATVRSGAVEIDLVLLDLNLPRESGWDVFARLATRCPLIPVVIMTGVPNQNRTALAAGVRAVMEKPIEVSALLQTIDELLAKPSKARLQWGSEYRADNRLPRRPKSGYRRALRRWRY
jgi:two-component system cell cycle sensor histidine kinase/response regulator CckA